MKKLFIGLTVIVSVICCLCFTASAVDNDITFFDFDEYATYSADSSTGLITADINLPSSWRWAYVKDSDGFTQWHNTFNFTTFEVFSPFSIDFNPFARAQYEHVVNHALITNGNFLDLQYIPNGAVLNVELVANLEASSLTSNFVQIFLGYVDSTGKVISHTIVPSSLNVQYLGGGLNQYSILGSYSFNTVPDGATGCLYLVHLTSNGSNPQEIPVYTISSSLSFDYSDLDYNIKQDQIMRDKVSNIEKQLGDLVNRPMVPIAPPGQNDFDDLHNNEQELLDQSQNYLDNGLSFFQNASGVILGLGNGFEAIKLLVQPVFALPFANSLITVSISLGLVATLIGVFISAVSNGGSEKESAKSGKKSAQGGKSAPKGGKK